MSTERYLVLSALGPDRPGIVAEVTGYVADRGGNIEDSRMAVLGGEFGVMMLISGAESDLARIARETDLLAKEAGVDVSTRETRSPEEHRRAQTIPCKVTCDAIDNPGIVRAVSRALHAAGLNIVSLETTSYEAPITGSPLFRLEAHCDAPRGGTIASVRAVMQGVAEQEGIDIDVRVP
jgi:glycine cleavage system transcriptional repressor